MISKARKLVRWQMVTCLLFALFLLAIASACARSQANISLDGQSIFTANCSSCHTIGRGNLAGPDLKGVTAQQDQQWLINFISNPDQVITSGDTLANRLLQEFNYVVMPNMGLTREQIIAVLTYIQAESGTIVPTPVAGAGLPAGDAKNGEAIFLGEVKLKNGGPFCIGCHRIDDTGLLGGGTLGADLTNAYTKYGDAGLEGILSNLPFLTMRPIFSNHTLTANERADIRAFLKASAGQPEVNKEPLVIGISLAGFLALMALIAFVWRDRLQGVRQELVKRARARK